MAFGELSELLGNSLEENNGKIELAKFYYAPVTCPMSFNRDMKQMTGRLMDFAKGTTTLGFVFQGGIIIAVDSRASMGSYISSQSVRKVLHITDRLLGTMAGGAADCQYWERYLGMMCRIYRGQASSLRWDQGKGPSLYMVDNDGTRIKHHLFSVGSGSTYAYGVIDSAYSHDLSLQDAVELGKRAIYHATHKDGASGGVCRVYHVHQDGWSIIEEGADVSELHWKYAAQKNLRGDE